MAKSKKTSSEDTQPGVTTDDADNPRRRGPPAAKMMPPEEVKPAKPGRVAKPGSPEACRRNPQQARRAG